MAHVTWQKGGTADVVRIEGEAIALRSSIPSPPGSRLGGTFTLGGQELRVKVHASRRQQDGSFVLEGRLIDATRDLRDKLVRLVTPPDETEGS